MDDFDDQLDAILDELAVQRRFEQDRPQILAEMRRRRQAWEQAHAEQCSPAAMPRHFWERFLEATGRRLHLPLWAVNAALYLLSASLFALFLEARDYFPGGGAFSAWLCFLAELTLGTWMLHRVRATRADAARFAATIESPTERTCWIEKHLRLFHKPWFLAPLLFAGYYAFAALLALEPRNVEARKWLALSLVWIYPNLVKLIVLQWVVAHLVWFAGVVKLARGDPATTMTPQEKAHLDSYCRQHRAGLNLTVAIPTAAWLIVSGLDGYGISVWAWLCWAGFLLLLVLEARVLAGLGGNHPLFVRAAKAFAESVAPFWEPVQARVAHAVTTLSSIVLVGGGYPLGHLLHGILSR